MLAPGVRATLVTMIGLVLLLQGGTPAPSPPAPDPGAELGAPEARPQPTPDWAAPNPGQPNWQAAADPPSAPSNPPSAGWLQPPFGYAGYGGMAGATPDAVERVTRWFLRLQVGGGPPGLAPESTLLALEGYGGAKLWAMIDGGYMIHERIGVAAWMGMNYRRSAPRTAGTSTAPSRTAPALVDVAYFVGAEAPILVVGTPELAFRATPRLAFVSGQLGFEAAPDLYGFVNPEQDATAPFQNGALWGVELSLTSFIYHIGGSIGLLRGVVGPTGDLGRDHDHGGFYVTLDGAIDG